MYFYYIWRFTLWRNTIRYDINGSKQSSARTCSFVRLGLSAESTNYLVLFFYNKSTDTTFYYALRGGTAVARPRQRLPLRVWIWWCHAHAHTHQARQRTAPRPRTPRAQLHCLLSGKKCKNTIIVLLFVFNKYYLIID